LGAAAAEKLKLEAEIARENVAGVDNGSAAM
jgi:hypothetical protein